MPIKIACVFWMALITLASLFIGSAVRASPPPRPATPAQVGVENLELEIFRMRAAELAQHRNHVVPQTSMSGEVIKARDQFLIKQYELETRIQDVRVKVFEWQIFAANTVLALVGLLAMAGVVFAGYQLWLSSRIASQAAGSIDLEVSSQKIRLQTSVIGLAVLVISGLFLLLFLRDVYRIEVIDTQSTLVKSPAVGK